MGGRVVEMGEGKAEVGEGLNARRVGVVRPNIIDASRCVALR